MELITPAVKAAAIIMSMLGRDIVSFEFGVSSFEFQVLSVHQSQGFGFQVEPETQVVSKFQFLCESFVLFVPLWWILSAIAHHRDTENTKDAQRLIQTRTLPETRNSKLETSSPC